MGGLLALLLFFTTRCLASENLFLVSNVTTVDGYLPVNTTAVVLSWDGDAKAGRMSYVVRYTFEWEDESAYQTVLDTTESVLNGTKSSCRVYCSSLGQGACCDGIFQVKMDNVNSVSPPTTATSMYFSATNSSVLQVSTVSGTIYNHVHLQSYPFGRVEWAMCSRLSQTNFPGFPQVSVLPLPRFAGASEAAMAPTPNGWELQGVNYYTGSQLKEMQAGIMTHYAAHTLNTNLNGSASSLNWGITVHQQNAPKVILTLQSQVMGRTAFSVVFPVCLLALMNLAIYLQGFNYATRFASSNIVFFSATQFMGSTGMVGSRGLTAIQEMTVVVLSMLTFTVGSSYVWCKLVSGQSVRGEFRHMWCMCCGRWRTIAEEQPSETEHEDRDTLKQRGSSSMSQELVRSWTTPEPAAPSNSVPISPAPTSFLEQFGRDESFKLKICTLGDNFSMLFTLIVYVVGFTLICVLASSYNERVVDTWDVCQTQVIT